MAGDDGMKLNRQDFLVLTVLADGPTYAYAIAQELEARTHGRVRLRPGNVYRIIDRLMQRGHVVESAESGEGGDERRRYFTITARGRTAARAEGEMLARVLAGSAVLRRATEPG